MAINQRLADARILRKVGLGPRPEDPLDLDLETWLDEQLDAQPDWRALNSLGDMSAQIVPWPDELSYSREERIRRLQGLRRNWDELNGMKLPDHERSSRMHEVNMTYQNHYQDALKFANGNVYGRDHVNRRLANFWFNHFTVADNMHLTVNMMMNHYEEAIFGTLTDSFGDMLYASTTHLAMLSYLDNIDNRGENSRHAQQCDCFAGINDNLGRELLELHSVSPARGYTEDDVRGAARILAGWGWIYDSSEFPNGVGSIYEPYVPDYAEPGQKTVLGKTYRHGKAALRQLTDDLAADPSTVDFLSDKLAVHFVGEGRSRANVMRIKKSWTGSKGDLRQIHRSALLEAAGSNLRKFLPPNLWIFQLARMSGAKLFVGASEPEEQHGKFHFHGARTIFSELANDYWAPRQPNGFSDLKADWVSNEHFDRRVRYAEFIAEQCSPVLQANEMVKKYGFSDSTASLVSQGKSRVEQFILLACSPEFMEV